MKKQKWFLVLAGALAMVLALAGCSDLVNNLDGETDYAPARLTAVSVEKVAEKTGSVNVNGTDYQLVFDSTGKAGTVKNGGSSVGSFDYNGEVLTMTMDEVGETYLRDVNGEYYLLDVNRLENSSGSGLVGKWVWKNGTPSGFYDYYYLYSNGVFQNPRYESEGYTGVTWKSSIGLVTLYDEDGNVAVESNGIPSVCVYDGTYLYPKCYLLTLN